MLQSDFIDLKNISKSWRTDAGTFTALKEVSISVKKGANIANCG